MKNVFNLNLPCLELISICIAVVLPRIRTQGVPARYHGIARVRAADNYETYVGQLQFLQYGINGPTAVIGVLNFPAYYIKDQFIAAHIHMYGDISENCKWTGPHFNPHHVIHGGPLDPTRHVGDLGNIAPAGNIVLFNLTDYQITLVGMHTVVGRSIVIHSRRDDYGRGGTSDSLIDGNSGYPIACGVIGIKGDFSPAAAAISGPLSVLFYMLCFITALSVQAFSLCS